LRARVGDDGSLSGVQLAGGYGQRGMGRMLAACCLAFEPSGELVVLDAASRRFTRFSAALRPISRWPAPDLRNLELGGLARHPQERGWLVAAASDSQDAVLLIPDGSATHRRFALVPRSSHLAAESTVMSPPQLVPLRDGSYVFGSGSLPVVAKLNSAGEVLWSRIIVVPDVPDALPATASLRLRGADYRLSSLAELSDGRLLATLFRPGRRQTVLTVLSAGGEQRETAVMPIPLWFYGVTASGYVVGARVRTHNELVTYLVQGNDRE
jgi:hypothetical protein